MDASAGTNTSEDALDQPSNAELGSDEPFDRGDLADVHAHNARTVRQRGDEREGIVPTQPARLRRSQRRNERRIEPITIEGEIHRPGASSDNLRNPPSRPSLIGAGGIQNRRRKKMS